jgi:hypothetical protein
VIIAYIFLSLSSDSIGLIVEYLRLSINTHSICFEREEKRIRRIDEESLFHEVTQYKKKKKNHFLPLSLLLPPQHLPPPEFSFLSGL